MKISGNNFIVAGGASGLGLATVRMLHQNGGKVLVLDVNEVAGAELQNGLGKGVIFKKADITSEMEVQDAINVLKQEFGAVHGLINCAGVGPAKRVLGREAIHDLQSFNQVVQVNLIGTFNTVRLAAAEMEHTPPEAGGERGVIVNTASVAAFDGQIGQAAYAASKGGIVAMTLPLARELARIGVRVIAIAPGIFETPLLQNLSEEVRSSLGQQIPFPSRLGRPDEFASLVKELIENQFINGEVIRLDGGIRMAPK